MSGVLENALAKRVRGERSSPIQAIGAAVVAGVAVGAITYRIIRS
jgi:stage V sporulation protein SpoVS